MGADACAHKAPDARNSRAESTEQLRCRFHREAQDFSFDSRRTAVAHQRPSQAAATAQARSSMSASSRMLSTSLMWTMCTCATAASCQLCAAVGTAPLGVISMLNPNSSAPPAARAGQQHSEAYAPLQRSDIQACSMQCCTVHMHDSEPLSGQSVQGQPPDNATTACLSCCAWGSVQCPAAR